MRKFHYNCTTLAKFTVSGHNSITLNHTLLKLSNSTESHQIKKTRCRSKSTLLSRLFGSIALPGAMCSEVKMHCGLRE